MPSVVEISPGIFRYDRLLCTKNMVPNQKVYGERLLHANNAEYRQWDLYRSKLAGAISKGLTPMPIAPGSVVLYLGAATGTTVSHISDIVGETGGVYAVEFAQRSMRDLLRVCESRTNLLPIYGDARQPDLYAEHLGDQKVDVLYQDVAQPDQAEILMRNAQSFLKPDGFAMLCVKSQSIDVTQAPEKTYAQTVAKLEAGGFITTWAHALDPYDKDHLFWMGQRKKQE